MAGVKREHRMIPGLAVALVPVVAVPGVKVVIPGRIRAARTPRVRRVLTVQADMPDGIKLAGHGNGVVQEVFVVCSDREAVRAAVSGRALPRETQRDPECSSCQRVRGAQVSCFPVRARNPECDGYHTCQRSGGNQTASGNTAYNPGMRDQAYREYIQSEAWRLKSRERLELDGYCCQGCGSRKRIRVHHVTYARFGNERITDLVSVCGECHDLIHRVYATGKAGSLAVVTRKVLKQVKPTKVTTWKRIQLPPAGKIT